MINSGQNFHLVVGGATTAGGVGLLSSFYGGDEVNLVEVSFVHRTVAAFAEEIAGGEAIGGGVKIGEIKFCYLEGSLSGAILSGFSS